MWEVLTLILAFTQWQFKALQLKFLDRVCECAVKVTRGLHSHICHCLSSAPCMKMSHCLRKLYVAQVSGDLFGTHWYHMMSYPFKVTSPQCTINAFLCYLLLWAMCIVSVTLCYAKLGGITQPARYRCMRLVEPITCQHSQDVSPVLRELRESDRGATLGSAGIHVKSNCAFLIYVLGSLSPLWSIFYRDRHNNITPSTRLDKESIFAQSSFLWMKMNEGVLQW